MLILSVLLRFNRFYLFGDFHKETEMSDVLLKNAESESDVVSGRTVAIAHRVKARVVNGEKVVSLPTRVLIVNQNGVTVSLDLDDEANELDFVTGKFVTKTKVVDDVKVVIAWEGLRVNDTVLMTLGGSGDSLAYAISRKGEDVGFSLYRMAPAALKALRGEKPGNQKKRDDSELSALIKAHTEKLAQFYSCGSADRERMLISVHYRSFKEAQEARMGQAARMRQSLIGEVFMSPDGLYPEGLIYGLLTDFIVTVQKTFQKKSKPVEVHQALKSAESSAKKSLEDAVQKSRVWELFEPISGVGPSIAGGLISSIGDIRKFPSEAAFWAYCGLHSLKTDGTKFKVGEKPIAGIMARRRTGQLSNWNPTVRQSLYIFADQCNRRPDSYWGKKLRANKIAYRLKHPEAITNELGKLRFNDGHIHKMSLWKTLRQFTRWLYREWSRLENDTAYVVKQPWMQSVISENTDDASDGEKIAA